MNLTDRNGTNTLFTITNAGPNQQIAHVTLWTDYAYPVVDFNVYLTGFDTQSINLFDIIGRGVIASEFGTGTEVSHVGVFSTGNDRLDLSACDALPGQLDPASVTRVQQAFTLGRVPACDRAGGIHANAVGYATIDVVRSCTTRNPTVAGYLTEDILWDNVLLGDYQQVDRSQSFAESAPMVHVRAVPEGGTASERRNDPGNYEVTFHRTFYSRFQATSNPTFDARQPLPALFAARWIDYNFDYNPWFLTSFKIWREGRTTLNAPCGAYLQNVAVLAEAVIFDEEENAEGLCCIGNPIDPVITSPATALVRVNDTSVFPRAHVGAISGWAYLNLDNSDDDDYASQNWVITTMRAHGRYSIDQDAAALGNGCSPPILKSEVTVYQGLVIGPAANINP